MVRRYNSRTSSRRSSTRSQTAHRVKHSKVTRTGTKKVRTREVNAPKIW